MAWTPGHLDGSQPTRVFRRLPKPRQTSQHRSKKVIGQQSVPNVARLVGGGKADDGKGKGKGGKWQARKVFDGYLQSVLEMVSRKRIVARKPRARVTEAKVLALFDETAASGPEDTSVGGLGLCSFGNQYDARKWNNGHKVTYTLDSGAAVSAAHAN